MKKQFLIIFMLVAATLSACSYKSMQGAGSDISENVNSSGQINLDKIDFGEKYITIECEYMHPLSSIRGGTDSYYFTEDVFLIERGSYVPEGHAKSEGYSPITWGWKEFPYTDAEWNALYSMDGFGAQTDLLANHDEVLYQPLMSGYSILKVDGELWLVNIDEINGERAIWSIYVIAPEKAVADEKKLTQLIEAVSVDITNVAYCEDVLSQMSNEVTSQTTSVEEVIDFSNSFLLYNFAEEPIAIFYKIAPVGYAIYDFTNGIVLQYTTDNNHSCYVDKNEHYYYQGIHEYYVRTDEGYLSLATGSIKKLSFLDYLFGPDDFYAR